MAGPIDALVSSDPRLPYAIGVDECRPPFGECNLLDGFNLLAFENTTVDEIKARLPHLPQSAEVVPHEDMIVIKFPQNDFLMFDTRHTDLWRELSRMPSCAVVHIALDIPQHNEFGEAPQLDPPFATHEFPITPGDGRLVYSWDALAGLAGRQEVPYFLDLESLDQNKTYVIRFNGCESTRLTPRLQSLLRRWYSCWPIYLSPDRCASLSFETVY